MTTKADKTTPGTITAGDASTSITVVPSGSPGGTGTYTDTIMKDAAENAGVNYGGYDYSEGYSDHAAQIGITDLTNGGTYKYRLYINDKQGKISDVTVTDHIPDGMTFNREKGIEVTDRVTGAAIDPASYSVNYNGQTLIFKYSGTFSNTIQINYWVDIPAGSNTSKYTNTAAITYSQNGDVHQEHRSYVLQGTDNNASNGEKSVDKSIISTDPDDQLVTYTIKFWNSNGFAAGEISLKDELDPHVKFVSADQNEYFTVAQDKTDLQKIKISNTKAIDGSTTTYVRFMVDMSNVPVGYTVYNTVGGNTTKTTKYGGYLDLTAVKKVDGKNDNIPDGKFKFQLLSENGEVLQTKTNDADGRIAFDRISYKVSDVGKKFTYQVKEVAGNDDAYEYDPGIFTVTTTPALEKDSNGNPTGKILADPVIRSGDQLTDCIVFNNKTRTTTDTGSLKLTKISIGHDTPDNAEFTITGPDDYSRTVKYCELEDKSITIADLPAGTYTVKESNADVEGYTLAVSGSTTVGVSRDGTAAVTLTNTYTRNPGGKNKHDDGESHEDNGGGTGAVSLYKVDAQTGAYLAGAQFALYQADGTYIGTYTTDRNGYLNAQNLSYGDYYFTETKAPEGYILDSSYVRFTLDKAHSAGNAYPWNIKVSNTKSGFSSVTAGGTKTGEDGKIVMKGKNTITQAAAPDSKGSTPIGNRTTINLTTTSSPATGDDSHMILYLILCIGSIAILGVSLILIKKSRKKVD